MGNNETMAAYEQALLAAEKSDVTVAKYLRDARAFLVFLGDRRLDKGETIAYKKKLCAGYAPASVNSMLASLNSFLRFLGREDCCVRLCRIQRQLFCNESRELSREEYGRLLQAARGTRMLFVLRTICETGIRVSELAYVTVEAVHRGKAVVQCKNKTRVILLPKELQKLLKAYLKGEGIRSGAVFVTKNGKPLNRSNIWRGMKALCRRAKVAPQKVFPHNLRHLFARTFYHSCKDIVKLADLLGHSSINTTRIYTAENGTAHRNRLEQVCRQLTFRL